jgi:UDPglucose--hexose-1-phosphate uridylyltransferase
VSERARATSPVVDALSDRPHRRLNQLTGEWVLVSPHRTRRPWQGQIERVPPEHRPAYDQTCYLCPGNERAGGVKNPQYAGTFIFENDFAALMPVEGDGAGSRGIPSSETQVPSEGRSLGTRNLDLGTLDPRSLLHAIPEPGTCRVICFSPRHDLTLPDMELSVIRGVVDAWAEEYARLGSDPAIGHVQIFENKGQVMGASNPHPHGQIWAQRSVPLMPAKELERLGDYFGRHKRTLLEDYLRLELETGERVVCENDGFVALVPFWAVWPFELLVVSRRPVPHLGALEDAERDQLADVLKRATTRYDNVFETSFPYSAGFHQAPTDGAPHREWHLHMHFYPPLLRSATVRKFLVGYEMLGEPQRDLTPETAAARLREQSDVHYRAAARSSA